MGNILTSSLVPGTWDKDTVDRLDPSNSWMFNVGIRMAWKDELAARTEVFVKASRKFGMNIDVCHHCSGKWYITFKVDGPTVCLACNGTGRVAWIDQS